MLFRLARISLPVPHDEKRALRQIDLYSMKHRGGAWFAERSQAREVNPLECTELAPVV